MGTSRTVVHYASGDNRDYEFEWSKAVLEYLEKGYPAEEKNCELEVGSTTYKVLKRDTVTAFYDADGNTLFDVTNDRLKEEYEAMESLDETEPKSEIGRAIAVIEKQAFDEAVYMGKTSLADIVTGNVPDPTPEEVQKAMEEQAGTEEAEGDEPSDDSCNQDIEETHDTEAQEVSEKGGEEEKADPEPTAKGIDGAVTKLQGELKKAKEGYAEPILSHMIDRCKESETLADAVCQTHKTWEKQHLGHSCRVMIISRRTCHSQRLNGSQRHLIIYRVSGCGSTNGIKKHGKANTFPRCLSGQQRTRASWRVFSRLTAKTLTRTYGMLLTDSRTRSRQNDWQRSTEKSLHRLICGWSR